MVKIEFSGITTNILTFEYYGKNNKNLLECSEPVEKKSGQSNNFKWVTALWNMYINGQN